MVIGKPYPAVSAWGPARNKVSSGITRQSGRSTLWAAVALGLWALSGVAAARADPVSAMPPAGWPALYRSTLKPTCARCHGIFKWRDPSAVWAHLLKTGWLDSGRPGASKLFIRLLKKPGAKPMPPPRGFAAGSVELERIRALVQTLKRNGKK